MHHGQLLHLLDTKVAAEWLDYNGHMNDAAYAIVFSRSIDTLMDRIHLDAAARKATGYTIYTMQAMLHYVKEAKHDAPLTVRAHLLEHDAKRIRIWLEMTEGLGGAKLAMSEQLLLSVDQSDGVRVAPWLPETAAALDALAKAQGGLAHPEEAGRGIALKRR
ncbi:thioesterase family protein [Methylovirgula sp. 4M-Z18]|uniref:thioesterase family protein n=1 Tax=Methylovirgula sp. 4M-Z18 TaxID=2293567 RepID=UPI001313F2F4|nr:thioesterase family protein [Methylovirgula sp. 4M-Z18]